MNKDQVINILTAFGCKDFDPRKIGKAVAGEVAYFTISEKELGRCYWQYQTLVLNHSGKEDESGVHSNFGEVVPSNTGVIDGVKFAILNYSVDSSD